jgi:hypothetical protein
VCSSLCIEGITSACFLVDCACNLLSEVSSFQTQLCFRKVLQLSRLTDSPLSGFPFMVETMFNHHLLTSITSSLGSRKPESALHLWNLATSAFYHLDLSRMLARRPDSGCGNGQVDNADGKRKLRIACVITLNCLGFLVCFYPFLSLRF